MGWGWSVKREEAGEEFGRDNWHWPSTTVLCTFPHRVDGERTSLTLSRAQSCTLRSMLSILPKGHTASSLSRSRSTRDLISVSPQHHWAHVTSAFLSGCPILNRLAFVSVSFSSFKRHNLSISCVKPYLVIVQENSIGLSERPGCPGNNKNVCGFN